MSSVVVEPHEFRRICALFPTGVAVLTTLSNDGTPHGLTINSFCSLSLTPPLVLVAIDRACSLLSTFETSGSFAINFLQASHRDLSIRFAEVPEGRFSGVEWKPGVTGSPLIEDVLGTMECKTVNIIDAGDHRALIGEAVSAMVGEGAPLVYYRSGYAELRSE